MLCHNVPTLPDRVGVENTQMVSARAFVSRETPDSSLPLGQIPSDEQMNFLAIQFRHFKRGGEP